MSAIDKRTLAAQHLLTFRRELLEDLGGEAAVSAAQLALVEVATRTRLYLDHVDAHLLERETLITRRNRLLPLVEQRTRLAESLVGVLSKLGLERRPRPAPSLEQYVAERYGGRNGATTTNDEATQPRRNSAFGPGPQRRRWLLQARERMVGARSALHPGT